jgi:N-methylhydantoinase A/oxoprolinase/acetone carboxylase beta subunit
MSLNLDRLEKHFVIQRCGLTLTDLLHVTNRFNRWDKNAAEQVCKMFSRLAKMKIPQMAVHLLNMGETRLTLELLKRQLDDEVDPDALHTCPVCQTLIGNLLSDGNDQYAVRINLKRPVVGIGAPIHFFLPRAAKALGTEAVLPENADVANAVGAITSNVVVKRQLRIIPDEEGGFLIEGLAGVRHFKKFEDADAFARDELVQRVRNLARIAGTSAQEIKLKIEDKIPKTADGKQIFLGRTIHANLTGRPDIVVKQNLQGSVVPAN